jgi:tetratricopeptide (TPR) repeat protein
MSASIQISAWDRLKSKLSLSPALLGQVSSVLGAFVAIVYLQAPQLAALKQQNQNTSKAHLQQEEANLKTQLSIAKTLPTFGFDNIVADWYFIDFIQYFGDSDLRKKAGYAAAMEYFDAILDRDPRFLFAYFYLSSTGSTYVGQPQRSVNLIEKGLKSLTPKVPNRGYYIWRLKAVDELIFLGKVQEARKSMLNAADWAGHYANEEGQNVAKLSRKTAAYLARNPNSKQAQFDAWNMVLGSAVDDIVVQRAIEGIRSTGGKVTISSDGKFHIQPPSED